MSAVLMGCLSLASITSLLIGTALVDRMTDCTQDSKDEDNQ